MTSKHGRTWKIPAEVFVGLKPEPHMLVKPQSAVSKPSRCFHTRSTHSGSVEGTGSSWCSWGAGWTRRTLENRDQSH